MPGVPALPPLTFRLGERSDLPACSTILAPGDPAAAFGEALPALWQRCLGCGGFTVIEDPTQDRPASIEAFGLSVFVPNAFADRFFDSPTPGLGAAVLGALQRGETPLLTEAEIAAGNSGDGLNVVVLHFGARHSDYADARTLPVLNLIGPSFYFVHSGYRVRSILAETYGPDSTRVGLPPSLGKRTASLSTDAKTLLLAAAADKGGMVLHLRTMGGTEVTANGQQFTNRGEPRSEARWAAALDELESKGYVEDRVGKKEVFAVTHAGYTATELLREQ